MEYDNDRKALIMLSTIEGYNARRKRFDSVSAPSELYDDYSVADKMIAEMNKLGVGVITILDDEYPSQLKEIYDPPYTLYYKGERSLLSNKNLLAVVGTRRVSVYGKNIMQNFVPAFIKSGLIVISGLARGVDSIGHSICVENGAKTVAVVANGLDICYPPENLQLQNKIAENGVVVSEYPLKTKPLQYHFPERNRIISGLSNGVFIPEAGDKSGSLITADDAIEQGRELFVVPGSIFSAQSAGCNKKIKELQATIVLTPEDVTDTLGYESAKAERKTVQLDIEQQALVDIMKDGRIHLYELMEKSGMNIAVVSSLLTRLEIMGIIRKSQGN
ncbi:MAG: DNA-processing protein DprA, partial [Clostridia bacterium]|nr:DNA-processing protein DprA [Clostridia bacterium]